LANGFDATKDTVVRINDLEFNSTTGVFEDLGEIELYKDPNNDSDVTGVFRRAFRSVTLFGPLRLARLCVAWVTTNIRNGLGSGEVVSAGDVSLNIILDNIPFTRDDTVMALVIDHDLDVDNFDNITSNSSGFEVDPDPSSPPAADPSETAMTFSDITRFKMRSRVYCDGNKSIVIRVRYIKVVGETPSYGLAVRRRLFITFHTDFSGRCKRIFFDPTMDATNNEDSGFTPSTSTSSGTGSGTSSSSGTGTSTSSGTGTSTGSGTSSGSSSSGSTSSSNNAIALTFGLFVLILSLF